MFPTHFNPNNSPLILLQISSPIYVYPRLYLYLYLNKHDFLKICTDMRYVKGVEKNHKISLHTDIDHTVADPDFELSRLFFLQLFLLFSSKITGEGRRAPWAPPLDPHCHMSFEKEIRLRLQLFKGLFSNSLIIHAALTQPEHHTLVRWMGLVRWLVRDTSIFEIAT